MTKASRPAHLADFLEPPLTEVVLGVQFEAPKAYRQIYAGKVWELYKSEYPNVEELPPLAPAFEIFGAPRVGQHAINFGIISGARHDRFWFLSPAKDELIQFQNDRLLHNWRKVGDGSYPRFEKMIVSFQSELERLEGFFGSLGSPRLVCNQAEISYINQIQLTKDSPQKPSEWVRYCSPATDSSDEVSCTARRTLMSDKGSPIGRLTVEINSVGDPGRGATVFANFTVRGAPSSNSVEAALDFLKMGREVIVEEFTSSTTDSAHIAWEEGQLKSQTAASAFTRNL